MCLEGGFHSNDDKYKRYNSWEMLFQGDVPTGCRPKDGLPDSSTWTDCFLGVSGFLDIAKFNSTWVMWILLFLC